MGSATGTPGTPGYVAPKSGYGSGKAIGIGDFEAEFSGIALGCEADGKQDENERGGKFCHHSRHRFLFRQLLFRPVNMEGSSLSSLRL